MSLNQYKELYDSSMKAVILKKYGSADNFEWAEIPLPAVSKGQIRIQTKAISFNPVDYQIRKGLSESKMVTSNILGRDLSGIVDEVHSDVNEFKKGDEVYCYVCDLGSSGSYAEYVSVPAEIVALKPASLSHEQAAAIPVAGITAAITLSKTRADKSKSVFVAGGAGGVGSFVIMLAKWLKIQNLFTTAGNEISRSYLINNFQLNPDQIINYNQEDFVKLTLERNGGNFDIAIDLVGGKMLAACCELLCVDGNLASVTESPTPGDFDILFHKNASFHSVGANAYSLANKTQWKIYQQVLNHLSKLIDKNLVTLPPVNIVGEFSVTSVRKAHQLLEAGLVQGKLVMSCHH
jgi:NADPH:quinone reductase-like Zn-dependent oxidoreductase